MPIYEYVCDQGHRFEVIHGIHESGPGECPVCHSTTVRKAFAAPAIHFKGSGWAKKDRSATSRSGPNAADGNTSDVTAADGKATEKPAASNDASAAGDATKPATAAPPKESTKASPAKPAAASKADGD